MNSGQQAPDNKVTYRVRSIVQETPDTVTLELVRPDGKPVPEYAPGQYNLLEVRDVGSAAMAVCVAPEAPGVLLHTVRAVGRVTEALCALGVGEEVAVSGPHGAGWPLGPAEENDVVIVAGGIGLAPMRPLLYALIQHRERYGHTTILYGARTPEDILYRKELEQWRGRFDMEVLVTVDRASRNWHGHVGVFTNLIPRAPFDPYYTVAYIAGPEVMMTYAVESLHRRGVRKDWQFVYMQRDLKRGVGAMDACDPGKTGLTGPVFRYDEVEPFLAARE